MASQVSAWRLTTFLETRATARMLVALALGALSFNLAIFPARTAHLRKLSGVAAPILDIRFAYSPELVFDLASRLGERGRRFYALSELTVDLLYPLLYSSFFSLLLARMLPRAFPGRPRWRHLALVPFAALACDYAENVSLAVILLGFPSSMPVAPVASLCTTTKWIAGGKHPHDRGQQPQVARRPGQSLPTAPRVTSGNARIPAVSGRSRDAGTELARHGAVRER